MAAQFGSFGQLPPELQLTVWSLALVPSPGVHFVRPNSHHNGSILGPASENYQIEYGPGISEVSYLSASCEHARLRMVSQDAREAVQEMIDSRGMVRIPLNPSMAGPDPTRQITAVNRPHIVVDLVNDMFVFSSFRGQWFPNYFFSGGATLEHPVLKDVKIMGIHLPPCNRGPDYFVCRDCGTDYTDNPGRFPGRVEFCLDCMASWTAHFQDVELVYLIIPGARRARVDDRVRVYRYGEISAINAAFGGPNAMPQQPANTGRRMLGQKPMHAQGLRPAMTLQAWASFEALGPEGPRCYHGAGITLFEVPAYEVPVMARRVMRAMFAESFGMRSFFANDDEEFSPCPSNPRHCGGNVEFRFLSF